MITITDTRLFRSLVVEALRLEGYDNESCFNYISSYVVEALRLEGYDNDNVPQHT